MEDIGDMYNSLEKIMINDSLSFYWVGEFFHYFLPLPLGQDSYCQRGGATKSWPVLFGTHFFIFDPIGLIF